MLGKRFKERGYVMPYTDRYGRTENVDVITVKRGKKNPLYFVEVYNRLREIKPDMVYFLKPNPYSMLPALVYRILHRCGLVFDCDEWDPATLRDNNAPFYHVIVSRILSRIAISVSSAVIISNKKILKFVPENHKKKIVYIPNGADTDFFRPSAKKTSGIFTVMYAGTLYKREQVKPVIEAMRHVNEAELIVVGPGNTDELKKTAPKNVKFYGPVGHEKMPEVMSGADALIATFPKLESLEYASNMKVFEYMAMEKPIIATDTGEIKEILDGGLAGYIVSPEPERIAECINRIMENPDDAQRKAKRAREKVVREYDWNVLSNRLAKFLEVKNG